MSLDRKRIRMELLATLRTKAEDALYATADGIGFCVAEIRLQLIPRFHILHRALFRRPEQDLLALPPSSEAPKQLSLMLEDRGTPKVTIRMARSPDETSKKYNYDWAVSRIEELQDIGVSDPVGYFNNEMADWWLAPDGMMDAEADFVGIARAIEERWHL